MKNLFLTVLFFALFVALVTPIHSSHAQESPVATPTVEATVESTAVATVEPSPTVVITPTPDPGGEPTPPPNAQDLVTAVTALLAAFAGFLTSIIVSLIKRIPGLTEDQQSKLSGSLAELVSVVTGIVTGFVVAWIAQSLDLIGDGSLRALVVALATPIVSELRYRLVKYTAAPEIIELGAPIGIPSGDSGATDWAR